MLKIKENIPHIIKYMGSKRDLLPPIVDAINKVHEGEPICDLFAGTSILSGAIGCQVEMHSNDIQEYSGILAQTYLGNYHWDQYNGITNDIIDTAQEYVNRFTESFPEIQYDYSNDNTLKSFQKLEHEQQKLIKRDFPGYKYHLFVKYYSGTYWSFEQCLWIDALRWVADSYKNSSVYNAILSAIMYSMAYAAQSTGHYAQYRDANKVSSMNDILIYRQRKIPEYFLRKLDEIIAFTCENEFNHKISSVDFKECLKSLEKGAIVYADPPYVFVHYSRFYHALETLVKYDFPEIEYKGRYRNDRHQSPFCIRSRVTGAFEALFSGIRANESKLVLSYSDTGMIALSDIINIADHILGPEYKTTVEEIPYTHSTMGRSKDKSREVTEYLIISTR